MEGKFELPQKLATLSLFGLGVFVDIRGVYWFINQESVLNESEFYRSYMKLCRYGYGDSYYSFLAHL